MIGADFSHAPRLPRPDAVLTHVGADHREENFASEFAARLPGVAHSERAYKAFLDRQRMDVFNNWAGQLEKSGVTWEKNPQAYKEIANYINITTGRGNIPKFLEGSAARVLNGTLFAPRYAASKVEFLATPAKLITMSPESRKIVARNFVQYVATVATMAYLLNQAGGKVSTDPDDPDFLKARFGDTRYDIASGNAQYLRLGFRLAAGYRRNATGEGNARGQNPSDVLGTFFRGKLSPTASLVADWSIGKDFTGDKFQLLPGKNEDGELKPGAIGERVIPLVAQDFADAYKAEGFAGVAKQTPGFFGVGVSTYPDKGGSRSSSSGFPKMPELPKMPGMPKMPK